MNNKCPEKRKNDPARYALAPGACEALMDLCNTGMSFDEALEAFLSMRTEPDVLPAISEVPTAVQPCRKTGKRWNPPDPGF